MSCQSLELRKNERRSVRWPFLWMTFKNARDIGKVYRIFAPPTIRYTADIYTVLTTRFDVL